MRKVVVAVAVGLLMACATEVYSPRTAEGRACKTECVAKVQACTGASYTCQIAYNGCLDLCREHR